VTLKRQRDCMWSWGP